MTFDRKTIGERDAPASGVPGVAPIAGLEQYRVKHAEFRDFAADAIDLHPVAQPDTIAPHEYQPTKKRHNEVLQGHGQPGADDPDRGGKLTRNAEDNQHNDQCGYHSQAHARKAAESFDLAAIQFWIVEQTLQPFVEQQQRAQNEEDNQRIEQQSMDKDL